jgi:transketolase
MRNAFALEVTSRAACDPRVVMLSGDIGNRLFDQVKGLCPERFHNCGVAEANMIGVAAGLAMSGLKPVAYTITPFITTRCLEQIKLDICAHNLPVVLAGVGAGLSYAALGSTHHSLEDVGILRLMPNLIICAPADAVEARLALRAALAQEAPVYLRLGKKGEPLMHQSAPDFALGRGITLRQGRDACLVGNGTVVACCVAAAELLAARGVSATVVDMHTVKPLDAPLLTECFATHPLVVTVEEHWLAGGFGSAVAEWKTDHDIGGGRLKRLGVTDTFLHRTGGQGNARKLTGLDPEGIARTVLAELGRA